MNNLAPLAVPVELQEQPASDKISRVFRLTSGILPTEVTFEQPLPFSRKAKVICQFVLPGDDTPLCVRGVVDDDRFTVSFVSPGHDATQRILNYAEERTYLP